jgi:hypothetical protein
VLCLDDLLVVASPATAALRTAAVEEQRFVAGAGEQTRGEVYSFF